MLFIFKNPKKMEKMIIFQLVLILFSNAKSSKKKEVDPMTVKKLMPPSVSKKTVDFDPENIWHIEAITGPIKYHDRLLKVKEENGPERMVGFHCTFESGKLCREWSGLDVRLQYFMKVMKKENENVEVYDFEVQRGPGHCIMTGPRVDHTQKSISGQYAVASMIQGKGGDVFVLASPTIKLTEPVYCLKYWYLAFGKNVQHLKVSLFSSSELEYKQIITSSEKSENMIDWKFKQTEIKGMDLSDGLQELVIVFYATRGDDYRSDLAIDDIQLDPEACPLFPRPPPPTTTAPSGPTTAWTPVMSSSIMFNF